MSTDIEALLPLNPAVDSDVLDEARALAREIPRGPEGAQYSFSRPFDDRESDGLSPISCRNGSGE